MKKLLLPLFTLAAFAACNNSADQASAPFDAASAKAAIMSINQQYEQAFLKGDSAAMAAFYTADARVFPPMMQSGDRASIASMVKAIPSMNIKTFKLNTNDVIGTQDQAVESGTFEMGDSTKTIDKGNYLVVWKKDGDTWKILRDIWNSSNPPAAMPPATTPAAK